MPGVETGVQSVQVSKAAQETGTLQTLGEGEGRMQRQKIVAKKRREVAKTHSRVKANGQSVQDEEGDESHRGRAQSVSVCQAVGRHGGGGRNMRPFDRRAQEMSNEESN